MERCNDMALSWLLNYISPDVANSVIYADIAKEVWDDLYNRFLKEILLEYSNQACYMHSSPRTVSHNCLLHKIQDPMG